jgi:hypothetical protein
VGTSDTNHIVPRVPGAKTAACWLTPRARRGARFLPRCFCASGGKNIFARRNATERTGKRSCGRGAARVCGFDRFLNFHIFTCPRPILRAIFALWAKTSPAHPEARRVALVSVCAGVARRAADVCAPRFAGAKFEFLKRNARKTDAHKKRARTNARVQLKRFLKQRAKKHTHTHTRTHAHTHEQSAKN